MTQGRCGNLQTRKHKTTTRQLHTLPKQQQPLCGTGKNAAAYSLLAAQDAFFPSTNNHSLQQPNVLVRMETNTEKVYALTRSPT
jgi:hypothetical protein